MAIRYFSRNDVAAYSVYNTESIIRKRNTSPNSTIRYGNRQTLQQVITFPQEKLKEVEQKTEQKNNYYLFGYNNILLDTLYTNKGYDVTRKETEDSQEITLFVTSKQDYSQYSTFSTKKALYYLLMSEKYTLSASELEQSLADAMQHTITHNFNGVVDYLLLDPTSTVVYDIQHTVINNNKISFIIPTSGTYTLLLWNISDLSSNIYKNVFITNTFSKDDVQWDAYTNIEEYDLTLNYRFSLIGYTVNHNQPLTYSQVQFDKSDVDNLSSIVNPSLTGTSDISSYMMNPNSNTINTSYNIQRNYQYVLINDTKSETLTNRLRVFLPNNQNYQDYKIACKDIYLYSSILSQTIYYDNSVKSKIMIIDHNLKGYVKASLRNIPNNLYTIKILNESQIEVQFIYDYKVIPSSFYVDLFLIWSQDNNE